MAAPPPPPPGPPPAYLKHFAHMMAQPAAAAASAPLPPPATLHMPPELQAFANTLLFRKPDTSLQEPDRLLALQKQYDSFAREVAIFRRERAKGVRAPGECMDGSKRKEFEALWLEHFVPMNSVVSPDFCKRSYTDFGFIAICTARVMERPQIHPMVDDLSFASLYFGKKAKDPQWDSARALLPLGRIWDVFLWMGVYSSTHTAAARARWPTPAAMDKFRWDVALLNHVFFGRSGLVRAHLTALFNELNFDLSSLSTPKMLAVWGRLRIPPDLQLKLDAKRAEAERRQAKRSAEIKALLSARAPLDPEDEEDDEALFADEIEDEFKETAEEDQGYMWRSTSEEVVANFHIKAQRLIYTIDNTTLFFERYPIDDASYGPTGPVFTDATMKRLDTWLKVKYAPEQAEALTEFYRPFALMLFNPLGWETMPSRNRLTATQKKAAMLQLQGELGADLAAFLHDRMSTMHHDTMLGDPDYDDALLFAQWEFTWRPATAKTEFASEYICLLPFDRDTWAPRFANLVYKWSNRKCPVIVWIQKRWWVFYQQRMVRCTSGRVALLFFLYIMGRDFSEYRPDPKGGRVRVDITTPDLTRILKLYMLFEPELRPLPSSSSAPPKSN